MLIDKFVNGDNSSITSDDIAKLQKIVEEYPFYTSAKVVLIKYYYKNKNKGDFEKMMNHLKYEHPNRQHIKLYVTKAADPAKIKVVPTAENNKIVEEPIKSENILPTEPSKNQWRNVQEPKRKIWTSNEVQTSLEKRQESKKNVEEFLALAKETKKSVDHFFEKFGTDSPPIKGKKTATAKKTSKAAKPKKQVSKVAKPKKQVSKAAKPKKQAKPKKKSTAKTK